MNLAYDHAIIAYRTIGRSGAYANQDYRQLFVKNRTTIYRVPKDKQEVNNAALTNQNAYFTNYNTSAL